MSRFFVPVAETTDAFVEQVDLDGRVYDLAFRWNARDVHWFLDVGRDGVVLIAGVKLVNSTDLLGQFGRIENLPPGILSIEDLDDADADPDDENFGDRVQLVYEEVDGV